MIAHNESPSLPPYHQVVNILDDYNLPLSVSEMHGLICGYLCAGAGTKGESYLRSLFSGQPPTENREAQRCLFQLFVLSQQQIQSGDFAFYMLLPEEHESLFERAQAFSEWCEGFTQGIYLSGIDNETLEDEDAQDALGHIAEFAELDYDALHVTEEDEKALTEVCEYTRMAVLRLHHDIQQVCQEHDETTH